MKSITNTGWMSSNPQKKIDDKSISLKEMMDMLERSATPETAADFGEIKGLYGAYTLAPSTVLLEAIVAKCLAIILRSQTSGVSISTKRSPSLLSDEWENGFNYFLQEINGNTENTAAVYVRALKRVKKKHGLDTEAIIENIDDLILAYEGNDQAARNVHISALRQFKDYAADPCGYIITSDDGKDETVISRLYCSPELAEAAYNEEIGENKSTGLKVRLYDKFGKLIKG